MNPEATPAPAAPSHGFVPLSRAAHAGLRWRKFNSYEFAASQMLVPLAAPELARAVASFPIVLARVDKGFLPMALLGTSAGTNLFIGLRGEWLGSYIPAGLRSQPFALGRDAGGRVILCIDAASPLVNEREGEPFFDEQGQPAEPVRETMNFLQLIERGRVAAHGACEALARHNCICPLAAAVKLADGRELRFDGLYQVDEAALNALPDDAFLELRKAGALSLAYAQLMSLTLMPVLGVMAARRARDEASSKPDLSLLDKDGTFDFGALR